MGGQDQERWGSGAVGTVIGGTWSAHERPCDRCGRPQKHTTDVLTATTIEHLCISCAYPGLRTTKG